MLLSRNRMLKAQVGPNFTWNPADKDTNLTLSNGNLTATSSTGNIAGVRGTASKSSGRWYFEVTYVAAGTGASAFGFEPSTDSLANSMGGASATGGYGYYVDGSVSHNGGQITTGLPTWSLNDVLGVAVDFTGSKYFFMRNGSWFGSGGAAADPVGGTAGLGLSAGTYFPGMSGNSGISFVLNQPIYTAPTGYLYW